MNARTKQMSRDEIIATIKGYAEKQGRAPSQVELTKNTAVRAGDIGRHFGTYMRAIRACELERNPPGNKLSMEALFRDWATVVRTVKKIPSYTEYELNSKHSRVPLKTRFVRWSAVPKGMKQYAEGQGWAEEWKDVMEIIEEHERGSDWQSWEPRPLQEPKKPALRKDRTVYGPLLRPFPAMHGPTDESGVIFLFGTLAEKLGFVVLHIQRAFPDCEALRLIDEESCQRVTIEFEHESANFVRHMHDPAGCDIIVCWKHNWPDCPLEVIELKSIIKSQNR